MAAVSSGGWEYNVNLIPTTTHDEILVAWVDVFVAAGWSVIARSDGTSVFTDGTENAVADWNANSWTQLRDPGNGRDFSIQCGPTFTYNVRCFLSQIGDPMTGGTATVAPVAAGTMAQVVGTGGAFYNNFLNFTASAARYHMGCATLAGGTSNDVYAFWFLNRVTPGATFGSFCMCVPIKTEADGTIGDADAEPYLISNIDTGFTASLQGSAWFKAGLTGETYTSGGMVILGSLNLIAQNPYSGAYDKWPIFVYDTGAQAQRKGLVDETVLTYRGDVAHNTLDTYNLATEGNSFAIFDEGAFRWPHNVAPLS